jgi:CPA1 family monovalent cation:H+ antiporter
MSPRETLLGDWPLTRLGLRTLMMHESTFGFILLTAIVGFAVLAKRFELPYPIAFVIGGSLLTLFPNLPQVQLNPDWVFLLILPPLLFAGGWYTDWKVFRENLRPIGLLAIGLVLFTTVAVAAVAHYLAPSLGWAAAFALGAIVSPPDAVAAGSVFERFSIPRRILAILDGEGLVNDATALVVYRFAIAAALTGTFSLAHASVAFVIVSLSGIALGLAFGAGFVLLLKTLRRFELSDSMLNSVLSLIVPYAIYLFTDSIQINGVGPSAVLATVAAGVFVSRQSSKIFDPDSRLVANSVWQMLIFLLNGLVFIAIGLQLRQILHDPAFVTRELWIGIAVSLVVIVVRVIWVYPATYLPRIFSPSLREREGVPPWNYVFVIAWSGMRGIVSLAAALALPYAFPGRNLIIFITFCVIVATLVFQGLSLIPLLKWLRIDSGEDLQKREIEVRVAALRAALVRLRELEPFESVEEWEVEGRLVGEYEYRIAHLTGHIDGAESGRALGVAIDHRLQQEALDAERREVERMRTAAEIPDEVYRKIEYDLDLANARLS